MPRYYLKDGTPVETWSEIPENDLTTNIAEDNVNGSNIVTVFTGFNMGSDENPKIFETSIHGGYHDGYRTLYFTEDEAKTGHELCVAMVSQPIPTDVQNLAEVILESHETNPYKIAEFLIANNYNKPDES